MLSILVNFNQIQETLKRKLAKRPPIHPRERLKQKKKETEIARKNLQLEDLDIETLQNQKNFSC